MKFKLTKKCICGANAVPNNTNSILLKKLPITEIYSNHFKRSKNGFLDQRVVFCNNCQHMFLTNHINPKSVYDQNYSYFGEKVFSGIYSNDYFYEFINLNLKKKNKTKKIVEVGSNDLYLLKKFYKKANNLIGIDPVIKKNKKYKKIKIYKEFFDNVNNKEIGKDVDIIICGHTLEHVENPESFIKKTLSIANSKTKIFFQFPSSDSLISNLSFDQIHHQHLNYFSLNSFNKILKKCGGKLINHKYSELHYGALMVYFTLDSSKQKSVKKERIKSIVRKKNFLESYDIFKKHLSLYEKIINNYLKSGKKLYVIGAGRMLPMINYHMNGLINKAEGILDDDKVKIGKYFVNINTQVMELKNVDLRNSICLVACVASAISTRKIISILMDRKVEIILVPTITF